MSSTIIKTLAFEFDTEAQRHRGNPIGFLCVSAPLCQWTASGATILFRTRYSYAPPSRPEADAFDHGDRHHRGRRLRAGQRQNRRAPAPRHHGPRRRPALQGHHLRHLAAMLDDHREAAYEVMQTIALKQGIDRIRMFNRAGQVMFSTRPDDPQPATPIQADQAPAASASASTPTAAAASRCSPRSTTSPPAARPPATPIPPATSVLGVLDLQLGLDRVDREVVQHEVPRPARHRGRNHPHRALHLSISPAASSAAPSRS